MVKKFILVFCLMIIQNNFSQTISENEKQLSLILDTLKNDYYNQSIPEDLMGQTPPQGYWKKYPFRVELYEFLDQIAKILQQPLSTNYLLKLYDKKNQRNLSTHYNSIADKIIATNLNDSNSELWNIATIKMSDNGTFTNWQFTNYVVQEFIRLDILKEKTREYILKNSDFNVHYCGIFGKEMDLKILDAQIERLKSDVEEPNMGDAPRWSGYLYLDNAIKLRKKCTINLKDWYRSKFYYSEVEKGNKVSYSDFDWDNYNDKKNIELTIRFINAIKDNYDEIYQKCESELIE